MQKLNSGREISEASSCCMILTRRLLTLFCFALFFSHRCSLSPPTIHSQSQLDLNLVAVREALETACAEKDVALASTEEQLKVQRPLTHTLCQREMLVIRYIDVSSHTYKSKTIHKKTPTIILCLIIHEKCVNNSCRVASLIFLTRTSHCETLSRQYRTRHSTARTRARRRHATRTDRDAAAAGPHGRSRYALPKLDSESNQWSLIVAYQLPR